MMRFLGIRKVILKGFGFARLKGNEGKRKLRKDEEEEEFQLPGLDL